MIEKKENLVNIELSPGGRILYTTRTDFIEDGILQTSKLRKKSLSPGADMSNEPAEVQAIASVNWTAEVIEEYKKSQQLMVAVPRTE